MNATSKAEGVRLNRFLAQVGVASRRACDEIIAAGRVRIDGSVVTAPGARVDPDRQSVTVDGTRISRPARPLILLLHKPTGVVSTTSDPQGRPTVIDLCGKFARKRRLFPVGRLDVNTTGALLITNDGGLCYRLTHPRFEIPRTYQARVRGQLTDRSLQRLRRMAAPGKPRRGDAAPRQDRTGVEVVREMGKVSVLKITLQEGRNRQVRRMCEAVGLRVVKLKRLSFGPVSIRKLPLGAVRPLDAGEIRSLERVISDRET